MKSQRSKSSPEMIPMQSRSLAIVLSLCGGLPMWGAISEKGFAEILIHKEKKVTSDEWCQALEAGKMQQVIKKLNPRSSHGPWHMLCDGESFLHTPASRQAYKAAKIKVWKVPAKSPDLNPIEKYWAWLRKQLRDRDFSDLKAGKPVPGKMAYVRRLRNILRSAKAQKVAGNCAKSLRKVCLEVKKKGGAASRS